MKYETVNIEVVGERCKRKDEVGKKTSTRLNQYNGPGQPPVTPENDLWAKNNVLYHENTFLETIANGIPGFPDVTKEVSIDAPLQDIDGIYKGDSDSDWVQARLRGEATDHRYFMDESVYGQRRYKSSPDLNERGHNVSFSSSYLQKRHRGLNSSKWKEGTRTEQGDVGEEKGKLKIFCAFH